MARVAAVGIIMTGIISYATAQNLIPPVITLAGSPACPCVDVWAATGFSTPAAQTTFETDQCRNATHAGQNQAGPSTSCLSVDYGATAATAVTRFVFVRLVTLRSPCAPLCFADHSGASACSPWDQQLSPECVNADSLVPNSGQPDWCQSSWCYVDPDNCDRPLSRSTMQWPTEVTGLPSDGLSFSYETCGNVNSYSASKHYAVLKGSQLRVSYPGDSSTGYTLFSTGATEKDGSFVQFMKVRQISIS